MWGNSNEVNQEMMEDISYPPVEPGHMDVSDLPPRTPIIFCGNCGHLIHGYFCGKRIEWDNEICICNMFLPDVR